MKTIEPNVVGVIHLRGCSMSSDLASQLAAIIYGPVRPRWASADRLLLADDRVLAATGKLGSELESLHAAFIRRS